LRTGAPNSTAAANNRPKNTLGRTTGLGWTLMQDNGFNFRLTTMEALSRKPAAAGLEKIPWLGLVAIVGAAYFIAARLGLLLASVHGSVSPAWPATGVAIGALLLGGARLWPGVALGAFAANVLTPVPLLAVAGITVGNTLEALTGAWIVGRCVAAFRRSDLEYLAEPTGLALAAAVAPVVAATCGVLTLRLAGEAPGSITGTLWQLDVGYGCGCTTLAP